MSRNSKWQSLRQGKAMGKTQRILSRNSARADKTALAVFFFSVNEECYMHEVAGGVKKDPLSIFSKALGILHELKEV